MEINRDSYLDQLIERKHNGLVKVITGLRRVAIQEKWLQVADRRRGEILSGAVRPIPTSEVLSEAYARAMA